MVADFGQIKRNEHLPARIAGHIGKEIADGRIMPGEKLPTEHILAKTFGVSRSVVREAIAELRNEGLVETRQGIGAFVTEAKSRGSIRIEHAALHDRESFRSLFQLRVPLEIEAAGLAAERGTQMQIKKIRERFDAIQRTVEGGENAVDEDFAFHCAVADATGNPQFRRFLEYLGRFIIPRGTVWDTAAPNGARARLDVK